MGWQKQIAGCKMYQIVRKMKLLKGELRKLHSATFSNILNEVKVDRINLLETEKELGRKFTRSSYLAEIMLIQRSKATWVKLGDDNTRYFYTVLKQKKLKESIYQLKDKNQQMQHDPVVIVDIFVRFYKQMLGETGGTKQKVYLGFLRYGHILITDQQVGLLKPYTWEEVKLALFGININKSPGPDGFGSGFFRDTWPIICKEFTYAILETLRTGKLLQQLNATSIALIPKVKNPEIAGHFRPIACCNVIYKCILKMLCKILKLVLSTLVNDTQAPFYSGRSLVHNVLICHDLMRHYNRKKTPRCLMKIDLRKAYDMVKWEFLEEMLHGFEFPGKFVKLIMMCVTTTKFSIKVNGTSYGYFEGKRGLRQGDPHFPLALCPSHGVPV
ncbi:uncharacterized protein LOC132612434 [Lycium barbarum]|uniref:uncharacterized protein LOC132612434 n=1 Tax=Lycium barbarum TaxID=112863 RepID=UPI00293ECFB1|nr:uncharacterized protein LOC132612434 [Lycium barbarum]